MAVDTALLQGSCPLPLLLLAVHLVAALLAQLLLAGQLALGRGRQPQVAAQRSWGRLFLQPC